MKKRRILWYSICVAFMIGIAVTVLVLAFGASEKRKEKQDTNKTTYVQLGDDETRVAVDILEGWEYEEEIQKTDGTEADTVYIIRFWPKGKSDGKMVLRGSTQIFGVCGTELEEREGQLGAYQVRQGFYGGNTIWNYTTFVGYEKYVLLNEGAEAWWNDYEEELALILETIEVGFGAANYQGDVEITSKEGAITDFGLRLFRNSLAKEGNSLVSPISVLYAIAMVTNGAQNETLSQMEGVLGLTKEELNTFLSAYMKALPESESCKLEMANGIWFEENANFTINEAFLQVNEDIYKSEIKKAEFDKQTLREINEWVEEKTKGRIKDLLKDFSDDAIMCLVNALSFDAKWDKIYEDNQVREDSFTTEDGKFQRTDFMFAREHRYIENEYATGFMKYYKGRKYAFVALLPKEGLTMEEYLGKVNGEILHGMLENAVNLEVNTSMPKFSVAQSVDMQKVLKKMGMTKVFNAEQANLLGMGTVPSGYNLFVSQVEHKAFLAVNELGTEGGAATAITVDNASARPQEEPKEVHLDKPFLYMVVDCEKNLPIFMGTVMEVGK